MNKKTIGYNPYRIESCIEKIPIEQSLPPLKQSLQNRAPTKQILIAYRRDPGAYEIPHRLDPYRRAPIEQIPIEKGAYDIRYIIDPYRTDPYIEQIPIR